MTTYAPCMSYRVLKWDDAHIDAAGGLDVPIYPPPDSVWLDAFELAHDARQDEVRGQVCAAVVVRGSTLVLQGVTTDSLVQTTAFFDMVVQKANRDTAAVIEQRKAA